MTLLRPLLVAATMTASTAAACDLALLLAVDVSGSVDPDEYRLQMDGLAEGLRDPLVSEALVRGRAQVSLVQWTGSSRQVVAIPWTEIVDFHALDDFAETVAGGPRVWRNYSTAIGEALSFSIPLFDTMDACALKIIDVSGDGFSNEGLSPAGVHPRLKAAGITVNAIAIEQSEPDLTAYFFENVIVGDGAFVETALSFADYPEKIRRKLLREVTRQTADLQD